MRTPFEPFAKVDAKAVDIRRFTFKMATEWNLAVHPTMLALRQQIEAEIAANTTVVSLINNGQRIVVDGKDVTDECLANANRRLAAVKSVLASYALTARMSKRAPGMPPATRPWPRNRQAMQLRKPAPGTAETQRKYAAFMSGKAVRQPRDRSEALRREA